MNNLIKLMCFGVIFSGMALADDWLGNHPAPRLTLDQAKPMADPVDPKEADPVDPKEADPVDPKEADPVDDKKWRGFRIQ